MEQEVLADQMISSFLSRFPHESWFRLVRMLAIHGIQELRTTINIDSLTIPALETIIVNREKGLIAQKVIPHLSDQIENIKKKLIDLDASVRFSESQPSSRPSDTFQRSTLHPHRSDLTQLYDQLEPPSRPVTVSRSRSPRPRSSQATMRSSSTFHPYTTSTTNLDYSYSPISRKNGGDRSFTPETRNVNKIRARSEETRILGDQSYKKSQFSTMMKASSVWRKGDCSVYDRSVSRAQTVMSEKPNFNLSQPQISRSPFKEEKSLQQIYIENMKETEITPQLKKSESLSSLIYPKWWKEMEPQPKTESRPNSRFMNTGKRSQQKQYRSRIERSLPIEFRMNGAHRQHQQQEHEFNISQITVNRSDNDISMTDMIDRRIDEIHNRHNSKKFNGTASFKKFVKNDTGSSQNTESTKPSIQFTIPTADTKIQTLEKKQTRKKENFLSTRQKNSSLAWNRKLNQKSPKKKKKQTNKAATVTGGSLVRQAQPYQLKGTKLKDVQSRIKNAIQESKEQFRSGHRSTPVIEIYVKGGGAENANPNQQTHQRVQQQSGAQMMQVMELQTENEEEGEQNYQSYPYESKNSREYQIDQQTREEREGMQQSGYRSGQMGAIQSQYSSSNQNRDSNCSSMIHSLQSSHKMNSAAPAAERYVFYDRATSPTDKDYMSLTQQAQGESGQFVDFIPAGYNASMFNFGKKISLTRKDSNAPQNQTAQFHPTSPSIGGEMNHGHPGNQSLPAVGSEDHYNGNNSAHRQYYSSRHSSQHDYAMLGPQLSTNSGGMIDLQSVNPTQTVSGPPTFQNRPSTNSKYSDPLQIATGFLNNPTMMNMFADQNSATGKKIMQGTHNTRLSQSERGMGYRMIKNEELIKVECEDLVTQNSVNFPIEHSQDSSSNSTPIRVPHSYETSQMRYPLPSRDSTPCDFYKQVDYRRSTNHKERYDQNFSSYDRGGRSSIGSNTTNGQINERAHVYTSHASDMSSGLPKYPNHLRSETLEGSESGHKMRGFRQQSPGRLDFYNQPYSQVQSFHGFTQRSGNNGASAYYTRGPSPATTTNPVTMNTNSSIGTGFLHNPHQQSQFYISEDLRPTGRMVSGSELRSFRHSRGSSHDYGTVSYESRSRSRSRSLSKSPKSVAYPIHTYQTNQDLPHTEQALPEQKMLLSGSTLSQYEIPEGMRNFFRKENIATQKNEAIDTFKNPYGGTLQPTNFESSQYKNTEGGIQPVEYQKARVETKGTKRGRNQKENRGGDFPVYKSCTVFGSLNSMRSSDNEEEQEKKKPSLGTMLKESETYVHQS